MQQPTFSEAVGGFLTFVALVVLSYIAIRTNSEVAVGALIVVVSGGAQYFLRAKVQPPSL